MLQELCRTSFEKACKNISNPIVKLRGRETPFMNFYGDYGVRNNWERIPVNKVISGNCGSETHMTRMKSWHYLQHRREHYNSELGTAKLWTVLFQPFAMRVL